MVLLILKLQNFLIGYCACFFNMMKYKLGWFGNLLPTKSELWLGISLKNVQDTVNSKLHK